MAQTTTQQPSVLSGAHANLPRGQGMPRLPTAALYPPDRIPVITDFNPEWSDWKFEYRRNMQEVLPNVFLGPLQVARNNTTLHANRITLLIPVRTSNTARFVSVPKDDDGRTWPSFCIDIQYDQIMTWFYKTFSKVKEEVERGGRVFIYCENGNGLSAAICVALVMDIRLWDYRTAREFVQRKRYSIDIPDWARFALEQYQPLVEARSMTAQNNEPPRKSRRRNLDEVYEDEIREGTYTLGLPHWQPSRPAVAPFSAMDQADDSFVPLHIAYPAEKSEEEGDEVMMDFVSGKSTCGD